MSVTSGPPATPTPPPPAPNPDTVTLTIDGQTVTVAKGTNVLEAARTLGLDISAFCYHPGLPVVAQCRQCLVSVEKNPKLQPSCQQVCGDGMVVHTTDKQSTLARQQMLEFTLVNHPIDCPICDKAGECTLQKLYFEHDNHDSRVDTPKVEKDKAVDLGPHIVLDQERCILCSRCIRTCDVVAGEHQLEFANRGDHEVLTTAPGAKLDNPYSLNTVDVCPVGALTAKDFRFTMRAWELEATPSVCNGCATGCNIEIHHKQGRAWRLVPRHNPDVNDYWMCDEGRFTYHDLRGVTSRRLAAPLVDGLPAGWDRAVKVAADRIKAALGERGGGGRVEAGAGEGATDTARASRGDGERGGGGRVEAGAGEGATDTARASRGDGDTSTIGVVLSAVCSNEDNFALAKLAQAWGVKQFFLASRPDVPARADGKLRVADVNPNRAGVNAIAAALKLDLKPAQAGAYAGIKLLVTLGDVLAGADGIETIAISAHERGHVGAAKVALPACDWAELAGTVTNNKGHVQRMHAAFTPPGATLPGWDAIVRLGAASNVKLAWTHAREVFKDMVAAVPAWNALTWAREARPLALRFAGSRG